MAFKITKKNIVGSLWYDPGVEDLDEDIHRDLYMVGLDANLKQYRLVSLIDGDVFATLDFEEMKLILGRDYSYMGSLTDLDVESFIAERHAP